MGVFRKLEEIRSRMNARMDASNTKLPYGIAEELGIDTDGLLPHEVWEKLEGNGVSAESAMSSLQSGKSVKQYLKTVAKEPKKTTTRKKTARKKKPGNNTEKNAVAKKQTRKPRTTNATKDPYETMPIEKVIEGIDGLRDEEGRIGKRISSAEKLRDEIENEEKMNKSFLDARENSFCKGKSEKWLRKAIEDYNNGNWDEYEKISGRRAWILDVNNELFFASGGYDKSLKDTDEKKQKLKKIDEDIASRINALKTKKDQINRRIVKEYPTYGDCKSRKEIEARANATGMFRNKCNISDGWVSMRSIETLKESFDAVEKLFEKYPVLKGKLGAVRLTSKEKFVAMSSGMQSVSLNVDFYKSKSDMQKKIRSDIKKGFHPKGCDGIESVIIHEYGHQIDNLLTSKKSKSDGDDIFSTALGVKAMKKFGCKSDEELCQMISGYSVQGLTQYGYGLRFCELIAECWSEYNCSNSPRPVAKFIGEEIEKELKKLK